MDNPAMYFVPNSNVQIYSNKHNSNVNVCKHETSSYCDAHVSAKSQVLLQFGSIICPVIYSVGH